MLGLAQLPVGGVGRLTAREHEVLELIAAGLSNSGIATHLSLTTRTVETHTSRIFTKLDLDDGGGLHRRVLAALVHQRSVGR